MLAKHIKITTKCQDYSIYFGERAKRFSQLFWWNDNFLASSQHIDLLRLKNLMEHLRLANCHYYSEKIALYELYISYVV